MSDPRYIIAGKSGIVYTRTDGAAWEGDGYHVEVEDGRKAVRPAHRIIEQR